MDFPYLPPPASWSSHALLTHATLKCFHHCRLQEQILVTDIKDYLHRAQSDLSGLIPWYWGLLAKKAGRPHQVGSPQENISTEADFLAALHLNPKVRLQYARLQAPEEVDPVSPHDFSREGPPGGLYLETPPGTHLSASQILYTYSDEPDWGMDQDLFGLDNYRYGPPPLGITNGISSQGAFHMAFLHEKTLLVKILPAIAKTFLPERVRVCFALAELAFAKGVDYWGWRFSAWAMHYLQDLTTPYHARAFPPAVLPTIRELIVGADERSLPERIRDIVKVHHVLFEGFVHLLLNQAVKKRADHPFLSALTCEGNVPDGSRQVCESLECSLDADLDTAIDASSKIPSNLACEIDVAMMALFSGRKIDDRVYRGGTDFLERHRDMLMAVAEDRTDLVSRFVGLTSVCLAVTGKVTRCVVERMCSSSQNGGDGRHRKP